jgi:hypothetical protein
MGRARRTDAASRGDTRAAALAYAAHGWSVIPIEVRGKRPRVPWLEFQQRIATTAEIEAWYRHRTDDNVGIVTGRVSGIVVIDVDPRHGGEESVRRLQGEEGLFAPTIEAETGGGGRHLYFAHPGIPLPNRVGIAPGIDLRGDGGCVVAPPSTHSSGRRYVWAPGCSPGERALAPLPHCFLPARRAAAHAGHPLAHWRDLLREGVEEGRRNDTLASLTGHLLWHGVDAEVALELLLAWNRMRCRPPLPDDEVARVVQSITRMHQRERSE